MGKKKKKQELKLSWKTAYDLMLERARSPSHWLHV